MARVIIFIVAFLLAMSFVFSFVDKHFNVEEIFNSKYKTLVLYTYSSCISLVAAIIYDYIIYTILI